MEEFVLTEDLRKDLLELISKAIDAIEHNQGTEVRELSDHIIHSASIFQDELSVSIAVVIYALSKVLDRFGETCPDCLNHLKKIHYFLEKRNIKPLFKELRKLRESIARRDKKINLYTQHILNEAQIKKGSRIYEHGISLAQTAHTLGISQWELMQYIGKTTMYEQQPETLTVKKRIETTRKVFGISH